MSARVAGSLALVSLLCFAHAAAAECTKDTDCKGTRICEAGVCVESHTPAEAPQDAETPEPAPVPAARATEPTQPPPKKYDSINAGGGTHRRSTGLMITGIVLTAAGGISGLTALAFATAGSSCNTVSNSAYSTTTSCDSYNEIALVGAVGFAALAGTGLTFIIVGSQRVPNEEAARRVVLTPWASRESGGLRLSGNF